MVEEVNVRAGDTVKKGDVLARMHPLPLERAVAEAEAALATAEDQLADLETGTPGEAASARAEAAAAEADLSRVRNRVDLTRLTDELERARNTRWGAQADRDSVCGMAEQKLVEQARCDSAQANVQAAEDAVRMAQAALTAAEQSYPQDLSAAQARASAANARLTAAAQGASEAQLAAARARVSQAQSALEQARDDLVKKDLVAPFDGEVDDVQAVAGVTLAPGTPAVTVLKTRPLLFATSNLSERNVGLIKPGATAHVQLAAFPDRRLRSVVDRVAPRPDNTGGQPSFTVYLELKDGQELSMRPGMTGRAEIATASEE
jgi:multidrug efflux pump subunit AcrA (membrane-fusion protein)